MFCYCLLGQLLLDGPMGGGEEEDIEWARMLAGAIQLKMDCALGCLDIWKKEEREGECGRAYKR